MKVVYSLNSEDMYRSVSFESPNRQLFYNIVLYINYNCLCGDLRGFKFN